MLALLAAALSGGCAILPHGAYWPSYDRHLADTAEAARSSPPAVVPLDRETAPERVRLQQIVTRRWADEALVRSARQMDAGAGRWVYADALSAVVWFYVDPVKYRDLVAAGIKSFRAALDNPAFRARFPEADDEAKRARLAEALEILFLKASAADPWFAFQAADWLTVAMEKNRAMLGLPDGAVVAEFLFGAMDSLDPYTRFLTAEMLRSYEEDIRGSYTGIGAAIVVRDGRVFLQEVFEGGAAAGASLRAGDEMTAVDGKPLAGLALAEVSRLLRGKAGTTVRMSVRVAGEDEAREVVLQRSAVHLPSVRGARLIEGEEGAGYVRLAAFKSGTENELRRAISQLADQGARALVLDLRDNPGGTLLDAIGAAGVFLAGGRVTRTRGRALGATWTYDVPLLARQPWRGPLVVLVNENTASAAEVLAAALARRGRATIVGRRTFGKGAAQINVPVGESSAVCLTVARVYDPADECIEGRGVTPDLQVAQAPEPVEERRDDVAMRAAIEALRAAPTLP
ncbi:MAG TPA: S41 family peptidase [Phycisphaerae bacterium]|nr:S41 family peptidase [Phycisphaerae bacterium]